MGYKNPPVEYRFRPGQSGNPYGRMGRRVSEHERQCLLRMMVDAICDYRPKNNTRLRKIMGILYEAID